MRHKKSHRLGYQMALMGVGLAVLSLLGLVALTSEWLSSDSDWAAPALTSTTTLDRSPGNMVDRLVMTDSADAFRGGRLIRVEVADEPQQPVRIVLKDDRGRAFPREGDWLSAEVETDGPFIDLLPSWNVQTPADTGVRFDVRVRDAATKQWTDWLYMGSWGRILADLNRKIESGAARVKIDEMALTEPADAYQIRARLYSFAFEPAAVPSVRRVAVCYSGHSSALRESRDDMQSIERAGVADDWRRDLGVPFRPQGDSPPPLQPQICSPTSTSMVMQYWGVDRPTVENALAIYDSEYDMFGNWNRAVQRAAETGLDGWLTRVRNWEQVRPYIAAGVPVIATIRFKKGEFPSALYDSTGGHLIVIRGFTKNGDVIVNDPARREGGNGVVYNADELGHAWFDKGGAAYIIQKPRSREQSAR